MSYLLDTNIISEVRKGKRCDVNVARWYQAIDDRDIYLSVLVVGEIRKGIELARRRDRVKATNLERWLKTICDEFAERILPITQTIADEWGRMNSPKPTPVIDGLLAATAKQHGLTLATRNVKDITHIGASIINPFDPTTWGTITRG